MQKNNWDKNRIRKRKIREYVSKHENWKQAITKLNKKA
jgi:hypothetical protein